VARNLRRGGRSRFGFRRFPRPLPGILGRVPFTETDSGPTRLGQRGKPPLRAPIGHSRPPPSVAHSSGRFVKRHPPTEGGAKSLFMQIWPACQRVRELRATLSFLGQYAPAKPGGSSEPDQP